MYYVKHTPSIWSSYSSQGYLSERNERICRHKTHAHKYSWTYIHHSPINRWMDTQIWYMHAMLLLNNTKEYTRGGQISVDRLSKEGRRVLNANYISIKFLKTQIIVTERRSVIAWDWQREGEEVSGVILVVSQGPIFKHSLNCTLCMDEVYCM